MSLERFSHLLSLVQERISKKDTRIRKSISAEERLVLTLRFLASGENQQSPSFSFRIGRQSVSWIVAETCKAIYLSLKDIYLKSPETSEQWENISSKFEELWKFLHVLGALFTASMSANMCKLSSVSFFYYFSFEKNKWFFIFCHFFW